MLSKKFPFNEDNDGFKTMNNIMICKLNDDIKSLYYLLLLKLLFMLFIKLFTILFLFIIIYTIEIYANQVNIHSINNINKYNSLIEMYNSNNQSIFVHIGAGLGNRLMSVVGIILLSIYYESKPLSIFE